MVMNLNHIYVILFMCNKTKLTLTNVNVRCDKCGEMGRCYLYRPFTYYDIGLPPKSKMVCLTCLYNWVSNF